MSLVCSALNWSMWCRTFISYPFHHSTYWIVQFRTALAATLGCSASMLWVFGAGRVGLYRFACSLKFQPDEHVILPGYTCVVVPNAVHFAGAAIRYVDISPDTLNYTAEGLIGACNDKTRLLVLPANFGLEHGHEVLLRTLGDLKQKFPRLVVIADMAHALSDSASGSIAQAVDAAFYSFEFSKCLTTGMGGALRINNAQLAKTFEANESDKPLARPSALLVIKQMLTVKTHLLAASGWSRLGRWSQGGLRRLKLLYATPAEELSGKQPNAYPMKMSALGACLGLQQLKVYKETTRLRKQQSAEYQALLQNHSAIEIPTIYADDSLLRFPVLMSPVLFEKGWTRSSFIEHIKKRTGLSVGVWFNDVIHPAGSFRHGYQIGNCPIGEEVAERMINLPLGRHADVSPYVLVKLKRALDEVIA